VIGGVITSTLLTLIVIPTVYEILNEWKDALVRLLFKRPAAVGHRPPATTDASPTPSE
jgi:HAE1 family hydrophobic/amphiphilic exporter-1